MSKARLRASAVDPDALVRIARERIAADGFVGISSLGPKAVRPSVAEALRGFGFEVTKGSVRAPLVDQLLGAVERVQHVPVKSIGSFVTGATATEARKVASTLVSEGRLAKVLRGSAEVLVPTTARVYSREELTRLRGTLDAVCKAIAKVSKQRHVSLLRTDVIEQLEEALPELRRSERPSVQKAPQTRDGDPLTKVFAALDATRDEALGLSFIPRVLDRLGPEMGVEAARASLLAAAARGLVELRPEGGMNRLTREELEMCLPGPQGTRLSWARRVEGRAH